LSLNRQFSNNSFDPRQKYPRNGTLYFKIIPIAIALVAFSTTLYFEGGFVLKQNPNVSLSAVEDLRTKNYRP